MPEPDLLAIALRHLERLLIVGGGILAVWLGYRMFLSMPSAASDGEGKIKLPGGISIFVSRVGPGVFFALFGAVLLGVAMHQGIQVNWRDASSSNQVARAGGSAAPLSGDGAGRTYSYSGVSPQLPAAGFAPEVERVRTSDTVSQLGRLARWLESGAGPLSREQRIDAAAALREARLRLIAGAWNEAAWGSFVDFQRWAQTEDPDPPPPALANAVRVYRGGP